MKERQELEENETMTKGNEVSNIILNGKKMVNIYSPVKFYLQNKSIRKRYVNMIILFSFHYWTLTKISLTLAVTSIKEALKNDIFHSILYLGQLIENKY